MKNSRLIILLTVLFLFGLMIGNIPASAQEYKNGLMEGVVRVKLKPVLVEAVDIKKSADNIVLSGIQPIDELNSKYSAYEMKRVFPYSSKFEDRHKKHGLHLWYEIRFSSKSSVDEIVSSYLDLPETDYAGPIYEPVLFPTKTSPFDPSKVERSDTAYFDDPYLGQQWHYNNTGQTGGTPGADINLFNAWDIIAGSPDVVVAVMDQGVDYSHEDLAENMWINEAEYNGTEGVDDDNNGYTDDIYGYNFWHNTGEIDKMNHGTHVSGTIAALNNNGIGVSGVAGGTGNNDGVKIMSCQMLGSGSGGGLTPSTFVYAADMGAIISQNSWGHGRPNTFDQATLDAIDYFIAEAGNYAGSPMKGGVVIFASGNGNHNGHWYPGYYESVIAVSALGPLNTKAGYSNFGHWVEISAPGGDINSIEGYGMETAVLSTTANNTYSYMDGTSMACPHVSGVAALIASKHGGSAFTNEDLLTHLLTGVNNIDTIPGNAEYIDSLGVGITDAFLAVATDNKMAPDAISDVDVTGIAQDFATIEWSVPADGDDGKPVSYEILFSEETISDATLQYALSLTIDNDIKEVGDPVSLEIHDLSALTQYYFAVRSTDRWGNVSALSNNAVDVTNAGPDVYVNPDLLSLTIDVSKTAIATDSFYVGNNGEGLLRWFSEIRHIETNDEPYKSKLTYPASKYGVNYDNISLGRSLIEISAPETKAQEETQETYYYYGWGSRMIIGEEDTSYTNSSATRFYVENPEGFNLTNFGAMLNFDIINGPAIVEVYKGEDINTARLIYDQELSNEDPIAKARIYYEKLSEQIYFEEGDYFWIVIHIPSGNLYPLGVDYALNYDFTLVENCFISLDMGKSWENLESAFGDSRYVWMTSATSLLKHPGEYLVLSPTSGDVVTNDSTAINVSVDASKMIDGAYTSNVVVNANDKDEPMVRVPVTINVDGHKPILNSTDIVDFGSIFHGEEKVVKIVVENTGYDMWRIADIDPIIISDPQFTFLGSVPSIYARNSATMRFLFKPASVGNHNAVVTLNDKNGNVYKFNLFGVASAPPEITLNPVDTTFSNVTISDTLSASFHIKNTGEYPLKYYFPGFADGTNMGDALGTYYIASNGDTISTVNKFGYQFKMDTTCVDPAFNWTDISANGTDIVDFFRNKVNVKGFYQVDLEFAFPFFGERETTVFITSGGMLTFDKNSIFNSSPSFKNKSLPDRFISARATPAFDLPFSTKGNIYYQQFVDKFIVQYSNIPDMALIGEVWTPVTINYQIVIHDNGDINIYYGDLGGMQERELTYWYVGIEDQNQDDGLLISSSQVTRLINTYTAIEIINPGLGLIDTLTNTFGTIQVGDSVKIDYTVLTDDLFMEPHTENIPFICNDPFSYSGIFPVHIDVTAGGAANLVADTNFFDFGQVFRTGEMSFKLGIKNEGNDTTTVLSANIAGTDFIIDGTTPNFLKPERSVFYNISLNTTTVGSFIDTLTIISSTNDTIEVKLQGEVIPEPVISVALPVINETLESGTSKILPMSIQNTGGNPLEVVPTGNDWLKVTEKAVKSNDLPEFTYAWKTNLDEDGPTFNWHYDVVEEGQEVDTIHYFDPELYWNTIALPFTFEFYEQPYDTIYVGPNGIISFTPDQGAHFFGYNQLPPDTIKPDNFIAPLWGFMAAFQYAYPEAGIYYKFYDDKVVVEYHKYVDAFVMGDAISFQTILYKDGNIELQYKLVQNEMASYFSMIGVENHDGTEGLVMYRGSIPHDKMEFAIHLTPAEKYTIAPGATKEFEINVDATNMYAGTYNGSLKLLNNTPDMPELSAPAQLIVTGEPTVTVTDSVNFGEVTAYSMRGVLKDYDQEITIDNTTGKAALEITNYSFTQGTEVEVGKYEWDRYYFYYEWIPIGTDPYLLPMNLDVKDTDEWVVKIIPSETVHEIKDTLILTGNMPGGEIRIPIYASVTLPPVVNTDADSVYVYAPVDQYTETRNVIIDNLNGLADLEYTLELSYQREVDEETTKNSDNNAQDNNADAPGLLEKSVTSTTTKSSTKEQEFNRVLAYENATEPSSRLGYGGDFAFHAAIAFNAPEDGFNLSHVQSWYVPDEVLDSRIIVEILGGGTSIENMSVIATKEYQHVVDAADAYGELLTIELDESIIFYPNELFYVVFKYPLDATYPQATADVSPPVEGRYMYGGGSGYYDIYGSDFEDMGWIMRAAETEFASKAWVTVDDTLTGVIPGGSQITVPITFKAGNAEPGHNYADLVITSNDPFTPETKMVLHLEKNMAPQFELDTIAVTIAENDTLNLSVSAVDLEGDNFTIATETTYDFVETSFANSVLDFTYRPDFESAGVQIFNIVATDAQNNANTLTIMVNVLNVNRVPDSLAVTDIELYENGEYHIINTNTVFYDPDGDELVVTAVSNDEGIVSVYSSGEEFMLVPGSLGTTTVVFTADDGLGGITSNTVNVMVVQGTTGIEDLVTGRLIIYPNPTSGEVNIVLPDTETPIESITVMNTIGVVMYEIQSDSFRGTSYSIDISNFPKGIYLVKISGDKFSKIEKILKK